MFTRFWQAAPFCLLAAVLIMAFAAIGPRVRTPEELTEKILSWIGRVTGRRV